MEDSENRSMDASSIKPVSSLRSHFEGMKSPTQPASSPSFRRAAGIPVHIEPERGRSSLDIPRKGSPWNDTGESQAKELQQSTKSNDRIVPRMSESSTKSRTRPMSMGPWSPPQTPPVVNIQSPRSPPKEPHTVPASAPLVTSPAARIRPVREHIKSPYAPPLQQRSPPNNFPSTSKDLHPTSGTGPKKASQPVVGTIPAMPPPINRAVKPNLVATRSSSGSRIAWTTLEPVTDKVCNKISPFSTPPSSEGSSDMDDATDKSKNAVRNPKTLSQTQHPGSFPPPPMRHTAESKRDGRDSSTTTKPRPKDARNYGFAPSGSTSDNIPQGSSVAAHSLQDARLDRRERPETVYISQPPSSAQARSRPVNQITRSTTDFLPPPKRNPIPKNQNASLSRPRDLSDPAAIARPCTSGILNGPVDSHTEIRRTDRDESVTSNIEFGTPPSSVSDYPDASQTNRRPPRARSGKQQIDTTYDTRIFEICSRHICSTGYLTKAWDITTGQMIFDMSHGERDFKITAVAFKPSIKTEEEGLRVWLGSNYGDIQEIDLESHSVTQSKTSAHGRREIIKIYRHQTSMWSLDEEGKLYVWLPDGSGLPNLEYNPLSYRVPKGHTFSIIIKDNLWFATGKEIRIFKPGASGEVSFFVIQHPLQQSNVGEVTSGAVISNQLDRIYFGHTDGKVSIYSTIDYSCTAVINVSMYKINTLAGAGFYLWAGYNTGMVYVYDTRTHPWQVKKDWLAHEGPVLSIVADRSSVWKLGYLQIASIGIDNKIRIWDGTLEDDWLEDNMHEHDTEYCEFEEISTVVATWNAGATTPPSLRHEEKNNNFFREFIRTNDPPDIIVFGFQELVDLEDKKLTAKSLFKGNNRKDSSEHEHMGRQYRDWRDFLVRLIEENMPSHQPYQLLHTANMVGLFSCIFVKASLKTHIRDLQVAEVKRGLGGFHGNKGALLLRFVLYDSSLCFLNCHLAAGQTQTVHRNNDIAAILESTAFSMERDPAKRIDNFIGGGDGCMVMDHEICVLNGDLNYRIDTMGRDAVVKAIKANDLPKLLERDQLLVSRRRNPAFRLRAFNESPITFAPTYKYDVGTDNYDSSEKHRSPAWCDRILYRGVGRIKQLSYQRHELRVSDHRPVSAVFKMRVKSISAKKRILVWQQCEERFAEWKRKLTKEVQIDYLVSVLGVDPQEAARLVQR